MLLKEKIIRIISIVFISISVLFFGSRTVYFYLESKGKIKTENTEYSVAEKLLSNINEIANGLNKDEDTRHVFVGKTEKNYLYFSGQLWRALSIEGNEITIVTELPVTALNLRGEYIDSFLNKWLNDEEEGVFANSLFIEDEPHKNKICLDTVKQSDIEGGKYSCSLYNESFDVGILDVTQYLEAGAGNSFLNNGHNFWLANKADNVDFWFVSSSGGLNYKESADMIFGVRVTMRINGEDKLISGEGTKDDPLLFEDKEIEDIDEAMIGDYLNFSGKLWRIVDIDADYVKIVLDDYMDSETYAYSKKSTNFNIKDKNSLAYYLNTTFLESLSNQNLIVEGEWDNGTYNSNNDYDYRSIAKKQITAKVGLLNIGDMYVLDFPSVYTMTPEFNYDKLATIYTIRDNFAFYVDMAKNEHKVRPAICISSSIKITGGLGTKTSPYTIGE